VSSKERRGAGYSGLDAPKGGLGLCIEDFFTVAEGEGPPTNQPGGLIAYKATASPPISWLGAIREEFDVVRRDG
jgi:hypothetical protein